jgi:hypothetical protein
VPCLALILALVPPRLALVAVWLLSDILGRAFDGVLLPILGFFLLPWTTLAHALMWNNATHEVTGFAWFIVVLAFLGDLGACGGTGADRHWSRPRGRTKLRPSSRCGPSTLGRRRRNSRGERFRCRPVTIGTIPAQ